MSQRSKLLPGELWNERLFDGVWERSPVNVSPVVEPATGAVLGKISIADPATVAESARAARIAQPAWYALSYDERAATMRKAAALGEQYFEEIVDWVVRESVSSQAKRLSRPV
ncbi:aldehyde dehydrogenase family protein [Pseudomonas sp. KB-10]|uniref:aldehyde dehydrogenase family protein n=1 Tax=Pseudomonas sp. KB-10 TaxID=2292264 RepID=UPI0024B13452|nr:aldehyde dehydrogenase family protein [Pseudomonas sp. KB-10]